MAILGPTWANLEPTWGQLGPTWANMEPTWGQLGIHFGPTWSNLGQLETNLGQLGANTRQRGPTLVQLEANMYLRIIEKPLFFPMFFFRYFKKILGTPWGAKKHRKASRFNLENRRLETLGTPWEALGAWGLLGGSFLENLRFS